MCNSVWQIYRVNHFELIPTRRGMNGEEKVFDELRLAVENVKFDKLSWRLSLYVFATKQVVDYINTIDETTDVINKTQHIKYVLYSDDGSYKETLLDRIMILTEISFESTYSNSDIAKIRLDYKYF